MSKHKPYRRVLVKLSGEALMGSGSYGIDPSTLARVADQIVQLRDLGVRLGLVIGGGNIFRGVSAVARDIDRATAHHMGMLATTMNALALQSALESRSVPTSVLSALGLPQITEPFNLRKARALVDQGVAVIFAGGTGNPFFTTDTAASLRALEIRAELLMKATRVDGIYDSDPLKNPGAKRFDKLSYMDVLKNNLKVMDAAAISLCMENQLPVLVFNLSDEQAMLKAVRGEEIGTIVKE